MKIASWVFFCIYTLGLILSTLPVLKLGAVWGMLALGYVAFAQYWVIHVNKNAFRGFFRSSIFHLIPLVILAYIVVSQTVYLLLSEGTNIKAVEFLISLLSLFLPVVVILGQYFLFRAAYKPHGILTDVD